MEDVTRRFVNKINMTKWLSGYIYRERPHQNVRFKEIHSPIQICMEKTMIHEKCLFQFLFLFLFSVMHWPLGFLFSPKQYLFSLFFIAFIYEYIYIFFRCRCTQWKIMNSRAGSSVTKFHVLSDILVVYSEIVVVVVVAVCVCVCISRRFSRSAINLM